MYQVINYFFDQDISLGSPFEISFQSFFEGAQKTGDAVQELNHFIFTVLLALFNCLPTIEYLWNVLLRIGIFIPYVIHSQYKQYKLEKRIYELTWTLSYQLRREMFKVKPPQSKTSSRTSSSSIVKHKENEPPINTVSTSSSEAWRPQRRSILQAGDTPIGASIYEIESPPVLFQGKEMGRSPIINLIEMASQDPYNSLQAANGFQADQQGRVSWKKHVGSTLDGNINMEDTCLVLLKPAKKFKRDTDNDSLTSHYSTTVTRKVVQKPQVSLHQTFTVEYFNVLRSKGAAKCPSGVSQGISATMGSTSQTKQCIASNESTVSWDQKKCRNEDFERKWRQIIERNNSIRKERLAKLRETEMQKLQEREKTRKANMMRRRAVIAKIREQNKKILMEQKGMQINDVEGSSDGVVLPVVRVKNIGSISKHAAAVQEHGPTPTVGDMDGQIPVLRVMQRTVTIEQTTAKISNVDNASEYDVMETKTLHMSGLETKSANEIMYREAVEDNPIPRIPKNAEYYLLPKVGPTNEQLVYVETRSDTADIPRDASFFTESTSEIYHRQLKPYGDFGRVRSNLQKVSNESDGLLKCTPAFSCGDLERNMEFFGSDSPGLREFGSVTGTSLISRPVYPLLDAYKQEVFNCDYNNLSANTHQKADGNGDPKPHHYDIEAPPSPTPSFGPKARKPVVKRARRRLQKQVNKLAQPDNQTLHHEGPDSSFMSSSAARTDQLAQQSVPTMPKRQDAKVAGPRSLLLKKIEVRKRLEGRRAAACQNPMNDLTSAEPEKKDGTDPEEKSEVTGQSVSRPGNKQRRFSLDVNTIRTKRCQSQTAPSSSFKKRVTRADDPSSAAMKNVNSKCLLSQPDRRNAVRDKGHPERPKPLTPKGSVRTGPNRAKLSAPAVRPGAVHAKTDGSHCRNEAGSPSCRRSRKESVTPKQEASSINATDNQKVATPESGKDTTRQDSGNMTTSRDSNFLSILVLADEKEEKKEAPPPVELKTDTKQKDSQIEEIQAADSSKSQGSDFLTFQMDDEGHPVPVTHSKGRTPNNTYRIPHPKKQENRRKTTEVLGKKRSVSILKSPKSKNHSNETINDKDWDERMKTWEKKRKQLSGRKSSQIARKKSQISVIYRNPVAIEISGNSENVEDETEATIFPRQNDTSHVSLSTSLRECKGDKCEYRSSQENNERLVREDEHRTFTDNVDNEQTASSPSRNECVNAKERSDKEEMVRVQSAPNTSSLFQAESLESTNLPLKLESPDEKGETGKLSGNSSEDSVGFSKNLKISLGREYKDLETLQNPPFSKSILSFIQSVSDNNYSDDGAGSHCLLKTLNTKHPNGDSDSVKKSNHSQSKKIDGKIELEHGCATNAELPMSCWRTPTSNQLQRVERTKVSKTKESISLESGTQRIQHRIEYPEDSGKENASTKKGPKEQRKWRKSTELMTLESGAPNAFLLEYPQDREKDDEAVVKSRSTVRQKGGMSEETVSSVKEGRGCCKNDGKPVRESNSACRNSKEISVILDKMLTVTKTLKDERLSKEFKKNHSKPAACDRPNDRSALSAITCCPDGSSIDDIGSLPGEPLFLESAFTKKRLLTPVVLECVASTPTEFYEKSRETNDRFLKNRNDDEKTATWIEWYEDLCSSPMSSEELETHEDTEVTYEVVVDRRGCRNVSPARCEGRNFEVKRYEVHHDASRCCINKTKRRSKELCPYY